MYKKISSFDKNNKKLIYNLIELKGEVLIKGQLQAHEQNMKSGYNFFMSISDQIDPIIIYFINDEISASLDERGPLKDLMIEIFNEFYTKENDRKLIYANEDLKDLFMNRTDFIIGSNILDFQINTFSVFETYIDDIYVKLTSKTPRTSKKEENLIKLISQYANEYELEKKEIILHKIKKINFYVSSSEKIDYVLSKCKVNKERKNEMKAFLDYYRSQRNTVHNLGFNKGKAQSVIVEGIAIEMNEGKASYTSDRNSAIYACRKLINIYEEILASISI